MAIRSLSPQFDSTTRMHEVRARFGQTPMRAAVSAGLDAIAAGCGGLLTGATCHVCVAPEWAARLPAPDDDEVGMPEFTAAARRDTSRLSCQIIVASEFERLTLELPDRQY